LFVHLGQGVKKHSTVRSYGRNSVGDNSVFLENVILGYPSGKVLSESAPDDLELENADYEGCQIGPNAVVRSDAVIYCDVKIGSYLRTGHKILVREHTTIGDHVLVGTNSVIDNDCTIGSRVSIQSCVYIPTGTVIEDDVFLGPGVTITNDQYPIRIKQGLTAPTIRRGASLGGHCVILPGKQIGEGAFVAAGAVVTKDVPDWHMAMGVPAQLKPLPEQLRVRNQIKG